MCVCDCDSRVVCMQTLTLVCAHSCIQSYIHTQLTTHTCRCVCSYIHADGHTYARIRVCIHTYMRTCIHACIHPYIRTHVHAYRRRTYIHMCTHTYIHTSIRTYIHAYPQCQHAHTHHEDMHTCRRTCTCMCASVNTHIPPQTHMRARTRVL